MNHKQATRPIRVGARWMNSEEEVIIEKVTKKDVYHRSADGTSSGLTSIWYFRENYCPVKRGRKAKS